MAGISQHLERHMQPSHKQANSANILFEICVQIVAVSIWTKGCSSLFYCGCPWGPMLWWLLGWTRAPASDKSFVKQNAKGWSLKNTVHHFDPYTVRFSQGYWTVIICTSLLLISYAVSRPQHWSDCVPPRQCPTVQYLFPSCIIIIHST